MDRVTPDARSDHYWQTQPCRPLSTSWSSPLLCWCVLVTALPRQSTGWLAAHEALHEVHHCSVDVFLWQLFPDSPPGDLQLMKHFMKFTTAVLMCSCDSSSQTVHRVTCSSSVVLGSGCSYATSPAWRPKHDSPVASNLNTSFFSMNSGQFMCSQFCMMLEFWEMGMSWVKQHNFVIFRNILTKLVVKCTFFLLNSCVKFHAKICMHCWNINKSRVVLFYVHPIWWSVADSNVTEYDCWLTSQSSTL